MTLAGTMGMGQHLRIRLRRQLRKPMVMLNLNWDVLKRGWRRGRQRPKRRLQLPQKRPRKQAELSAGGIPLTQDFENHQEHQQPPQRSDSTVSAGSLTSEVADKRKSKRGRPRKSVTASPPRNSATASPPVESPFALASIPPDASADRPKRRGRPSAPVFYTTSSSGPMQVVVPPQDPALTEDAKFAAALLKSADVNTVALSPVKPVPAQSLPPVVPADAAPTDHLYATALLKWQAGQSQGEGEPMDVERGEDSAHGGEEEEDEEDEDEEKSQSENGGNLEGGDGVVDAGGEPKLSEQDIMDGKRQRLYRRG
ncbi:hypothetical protein BC829DRAFT_243527 [Chytridium lagenaria]|nr:hypothetical protein BC829DRAFT_243527 [Chytridium lagenaria]